MDEMSSISEEIFVNNEERLTRNVSDSESWRYEGSQERWSRIEDKFRCLIVKNIQCFTVVEFLDQLLVHIRKTPILTRQFTSSIFFYLIATKNLVSNISLDKSYYNHVRQILTVYCVYQLKSVTCFEDDSNLASDIFMKITLLMQCSKEITVADVLIDINNDIQSIRSSNIMKIVHRKYLSQIHIGGPIQMDDNEFVKHLILFHLWYKSENINEKPNVLRMFLMTLKPSCQLRSNPVYSLYLNSYNPDVADDYKKLILHPFRHEALVQALRHDEMKKWQVEFQETIDLCDDLCFDDELMVVEPAQSLLVEVINVDDSCEINYLAKLSEQLSDLRHGENRQISRKRPADAVINISDSDEDCARISNNSFRGTTASPVEECKSQSESHIPTPNVHQRSEQQGHGIRSSLKVMKTSCERNEQKTCTKSKNVTFRDPLVSDVHVFERYASNDEMETTKKKIVRRTKNRKPRPTRRTSIDAWMKRNIRPIDNTFTGNSTNLKKVIREGTKSFATRDMEDCLQFVRLNGCTVELQKCNLRLQSCSVRLQRCSEGLLERRTMRLQKYKGKQWHIFRTFIK